MESPTSSYLQMEIHYTLDTGRSVEESQCLCVLCLTVYFMQHDKIQSWDLRNPGKMLCEMKREVSTNQRIYFDFYK